MSELVFLFSADADIQTAYAFYEAVQTGRGEVFMRHLDVAFGQLRKPSEGTHLVQPLGQHVGLDAPQELHRLESQLFARTGPVLGVSEGHARCVTGYDGFVTHRRALHIEGKAAKEGLGWWVSGCLELAHRSDSPTGWISRTAPKSLSSGSAASAAS